MDKRLEIIDEKLTILLNNMNYNDYLDFINNNKLLKSYDSIMSRMEINMYPVEFSVMLTDNVLDNIEKLIDKKIKELNL